MTGRRSEVLGNMEKGFTKQMAQDLAMIADCLKQVFAGHVRYAGLQEAMEYSLMAGGKRIRPVLTLETCRLLLDPRRPARHG